MKHNLKLYVAGSIPKYLFILDNSKGYYGTDIKETLDTTENWWFATNPYLESLVEGAILVHETDSFDLEDTETTYNEIQVTLLLEN